MNCGSKLKEAIFGIPMVNGKLSQAVGIIKGYMAGQIFVLLFSSFRGTIVKESSDDERNFKYTNILDNILAIALLVALLLSLYFIKTHKKRIIMIFSFKVFLMLFLIELTLLFKPDHRRLISLLSYDLEYSCMNTFSSI